MRKISRSLKLVYGTTLIAATLGIIELACRLAPEFPYKKLTQEIVTPIIDKDPELSDENQRTEFQVKRYLTNSQNRPRAPHPYFGYVLNRSLLSSVNREGFLMSPELFEVRGSDVKHYYIGIFGGSVAGDFYRFELKLQKLGQPNLISLLKQKFPKQFEQKQIVLLNFAEGGYKQPQHYFINSYYSDRIHMGITIDGYNEIASRVRPEFPIEFPEFSKFFFSQNPARGKYYAKLYDLIQRRLSVTKYWIQHPLLNTSAAMQRVWFGYFLWVENRLAEAHSSFKHESDRKFPYFLPGQMPSTEAEQVQALVGVWYKYSKLQYGLMKSLSLPYLHFIQPNQHFDRSKKLTDEEKRLFFSPEKKARVQLGYEKLMEKYTTLKNAGYPIYDLTDSFKTEDGTVYRDKCCHFNPQGKKLFAESIYNQVITYFESR